MRKNFYEDERPAELPVEPKPPREVVLREVVVVERLELRAVGVKLVRCGDGELVRDEPGQMLREERESPELYDGPQLPHARDRRHGCVCCCAAGAGVTPGTTVIPPDGDGAGFAAPGAGCCCGTTQSRRGGVMA